MVSKISIANYKSIQNLDFPLSRVNVFIGENGSGKSNILEAIAMACAAQMNQLTTEDFFNRGIRVAKPALTFNSFLDKNKYMQKKNNLFSAENANEGALYILFYLVEGKYKLSELWMRGFIDC
jgi:AAA15 family ATPase/GTPase